MVAIQTFTGSVGSEEAFDVLKTLDEELLRKVFCLVADTIALNTGCKTGVFRRLKVFFKEIYGRDIHTVECLLRTMESLMRHFF